jgi:hypothetical protein
MAVSVHDATPLISGNSYTTSLDATHPGIADRRGNPFSTGQHPGPPRRGIAQFKTRFKLVTPGSCQAARSAPVQCSQDRGEDAGGGQNHGAQGDEQISERLNHPYRSRVSTAIGGAGGVQAEALAPGGPASPKILTLGWDAAWGTGRPGAADPRDRRRSSRGYRHCGRHRLRQHIDPPPRHRRAPRREDPVRTGTIARFRSAAAFALFAGVAWIEVSSGDVLRHRLSPPGTGNSTRLLE